MDNNQFLPASWMFGFSIKCITLQSVEFPGVSFLLIIFAKVLLIAGFRQTVKKAMYKNVQREALTATAYLSLVRPPLPSTVLAGRFHGFHPIINEQIIYFSQIRHVV